MSKFFVPAQPVEATTCLECGAKVAGKGSLLMDVDNDMFPAMVSVEKFICMRCMAQRPVGEAVPAPMLGTPVIGIKKG